MEIKNALAYRADVVALLESVKLPAEDLPQLLDNFLVMHDGDRIVAAAGVELYGPYALLRSVAVSPDLRDKGIAAKMLTAVENMAQSKQIEAIYLLTETAAHYFNRKGYRPVRRDKIPKEVQESSEFSHVCPQSALAMEKILTEINSAE